MDGNVNVPGASAAEVAKLRKAITPTLGSGKPTSSTSAAVGQTYIDENTGTSYTCTAVSETGETSWRKTGVTSADQIAYGEDTTLADALSGLEESAEAGTPLSGDSDPTETTKGAVGQKYLNTTTGNEFTCMAVNGDGTYTWGQPSNSGGGTVPSHTQSADTITAGTFGGAVVAQNDTDYTTYKVRNAAILSAVPASMNNGDIAFVYS